MNVFAAQSAITPELFAKRFSHAGRSRPAMLICETVNACNLDCIICAYSQQTRPTELMPLDLFEKVLHDYSELGGGCLSLTPTVGDVLLDRRLTDRFRLIEGYPKIGPVSFTTNGVLAASRDPEELAWIAGRMRRILVSVYGLDAEEYHRMTRKDRFEDMLEGVRRLIAACGDRTQLFLGFRLLHERSQEDLSKWIVERFGRSLPFGSTTQYANWGGAVDTASPLPGDAKWIPVRYNKGQCAIPLLAMQVSSNGDVSFCPCDDFKHVEELSLGNVRDATLAEMYNSPKVARLYDFAAHVPAFCRGCSFHLPLEDTRQVEELCRDPTASIGG